LRSIIVNNALSQAQKIHSRKIIDADKNALIKEYQKRLVELSFARKNKDDVSEEYDQIVKKIQILRHGVDEIH